jgi:hypothetical protein
VEDLSSLPAIAGNYVYVREDGLKPVVICCGAAETLHGAASRWPAAQQSHGAKTIYVRRNVSWKTRASEHDDIVARHQPPLIAGPEFGAPPGDQ